MTLLLILLAIPGVLAVLLRLSRSVFHAARFSLERFYAGQIMGQRAQRGDITGMEEAAVVRSAAAAKQLRFLGETLLWAGLLLLPLLFPPAVVLYPFYSIFWFV